MEILIPISSPDSAREAIKYTASEYPDASMTVLHVLPLHTSHTIGGMYVHPAAIESDRTKADQLFEVATEAAEALGASITTMTAVGSPVREITAYAENFSTDHIVVGNCDRSGLLRFLLQNVTKGVVSRSPVPVTVVK